MSWRSSWRVSWGSSLVNLVGEMDKLRRQSSAHVIQKNPIHKFGKFLFFLSAGGCEYCFGPRTFSRVCLILVISNFFSRLEILFWSLHFFNRVVGLCTFKMFRFDFLTINFYLF